MTLILAALVLSSSIAAPLVASSRAAAQDDEQQCGQVVQHDALLTQEAVDAVNATGEATSRTDNTAVRVEDVPGFVRLNATNPNGYCIRYEVAISEEIVSPADLGEIESVDGNTTASWRAEQNLTAGTVRTEVTFTLPPDGTATFAPSQVRVRSLSWTGTAKKESQGVLDGLRSLFGDGKLEEREYEIEPAANGSRVTVPLTQDGQEIEDWQASYTLDGQTKPVEQDASAPVYYTESSGSVTFHFNEEAVRGDASVTFVAEPRIWERAAFSAESYLSGLSSGPSWLPWTTTVLEGIA